MTHTAFDQVLEEDEERSRYGGGALLRVVLQRLGLGVLTLFFVSIIIFASVEMLPGDFARSVLGQSATPETVAAFERQIGLDRPPLQRYFEWVGGVLQGDFGNSYSGAGSLSGDQREVVDLIAPRLGKTLFLAGVTALIAVPLSLALGLLAALHRNGVMDRAINVAAIVSISVPEFFVAYLLMLLLAVTFPVFPSVANVAGDASLLEALEHMALPVLTLVLGTIAHMMRMTRAAIINLLALPYIEMARLKGIPPALIILRHALPNAWAPIATIVALYLAYLVTGVVVVEVVFVFPGIGQLMVDAVASRDIPVVQACGIIFAAVYIVLNLLADIVAIVTNPRLLHP